MYYPSSESEIIYIIGKAIRVRIEDCDLGNIIVKFFNIIIRIGNYNPHGCKINDNNDMDDFKHFYGKHDKTNQHVSEYYQNIIQLHIKFSKKYDIVIIYDPCDVDKIDDKDFIDAWRPYVNERFIFHFLNTYYETVRLKRNNPNKGIVLYVGQHNVKVIIEDYNRNDYKRIGEIIQVVIKDHRIVDSIELAAYLDAIVKFVSHGPMSEYERSDSDIIKYLHELERYLCRFGLTDDQIHSLIIVIYETSLKMLNYIHL